MSPSKRPSVPARPKAKAAPKAAAAVVPTKPKRSALVPAALVGLVVLALAIQGAWVFYHDRKTMVTLHYEAAIAVRGPGRGQVQGARAMGADAKGNVYYLQGVGDTSMLQKFARDGKWIAWVSPESKPADRLDNGFAVAGAPDGTAWVCERGSGALKHYGEDLKLLARVQLEQRDLTGIAVAPNGTVWVASFTGQILALRPGADKVETFGGDGKGRLIAPFRLCVDGDGSVYVLDFDLGVGKDPMIKVFDDHGHFSHGWRVKDWPTNEFACIAWHPLGYVVINDPRPEVVDAKGFEMFSPKGKLVSLVTLADNGQNLRSIPAFAITASGDWFMDLTPLQEGCGRLSWTPVP